MTIPSREGVVGQFKSDPELTISESGRKRLFAWVEIQYTMPGEDGKYPSPERSQLIMFNASAERAAETYRSGDNFIALGRVETDEYNGQTRERFVASAIGPNGNLSKFVMQRGREQRREQARDTAAREGVGPEEVDRDPRQTETAGAAAAVLAQREQELTPDPEPATTKTSGKVLAGAGLPR
jgi:single-stranded DNA-binding protein